MILKKWRKKKTANTGHSGIWLHNRSGHVLRELPTNSRNFQNKKTFKTYIKPQPTSFGGVNEARNPAQKNLHKAIETKICFRRLSLPSVSSPSFLSLPLSPPLHPLRSSHVPHPSTHPSILHPSTPCMDDSGIHHVCMITSCNQTPRCPFLVLFHSLMWSCATWMSSAGSWWIIYVFK